MTLFTRHCGGSPGYLLIDGLNQGNGNAWRFIFKL